MADVTDRERELEQEVEVQRAAADAAAELIGVLSERLHFYREACQDEVRRHMATMERFLGQAATIEDWGRRLERIFTRHSRDEDGRCKGCGQPHPCKDRKDAEWNPNPSSS
jgi:hypothetical protein